LQAWPRHHWQENAVTAILVMHPLVVDTLLVVQEVCVTLIIPNRVMVMEIAQVAQFHRLIHRQRQRQFQVHQLQVLLVEMPNVAGAHGVMQALVVDIHQGAVVVCAALIGQNRVLRLGIALPSRHHLHHHHQPLRRVQLHQHQFRHLQHLDHHQHQCQFLLQPLVELVVLSCLGTWRIGAHLSSGGMRTCLDTV